MGKCPGQDSQQWGFDAIFDVACPKCHAALEFFKDDARRYCAACGTYMTSCCRAFKLRTLFHDVRASTLTS